MLQPRPPVSTAGFPVHGGLLDDLTAAAATAMVTVAVGLSYAALLFGGTPPDVQAQGLFAVLASIAVLGIAGAWLSTVPITVVSFEGASIAVLATAVPAIMSHMPGAAPGALGATLLAGLASAAFVTGLAMYLLGWLRGGAMVRFMPLQVMAGLIAATGCALVQGGLSVGIGGLAGWGMARDGTALLHAAPAVAGALAIHWTLRRSRSPVVLPAVLVGGVLLYHSTFLALGWTAAEQRMAGWLLAPPPPFRPSLPWTPDMLAAVHWEVLAASAPMLAAVALLTCLTTLINVNGIEIATRCDIDLDRDLRAGGVSNMLSGLCAGILGNASMSRTVMLHRMGAGRRWAPMLMAGLAATVPMVAPGLLGLVPRFVLGALLINAGLGFLQTWLVDVRTRLSRAEWLTVVAVVGVAVQFGLPAAVFAGMTLGCFTFALDASRGSPIRARYTGMVARSNVERTMEQRTVLDAEPSAISVFYLQGYLFFGTAKRLLDVVRREMARDDGRLRHLVLEGSNIAGLDGSARETFERLRALADAHRVILTFAALPQAARAQLADVLRPGVTDAPTLDDALEQCEDALLAGHDAAVPGPLLATLAAGFDDPADIAALGRILVPGGAPAGAILFRQGEVSDHMLFIESGHATVCASFEGAPEIRLRRCGPGTMLGEIGFLLGQPRTATVRADDECRTWILTRAALAQLAYDQPKAALALQAALLRALSFRLLDKDEQLVAMARGLRRTGPG